MADRKTEAGEILFFPKLSSQRRALEVESCLRLSPLLGVLSLPSGDPHSTRPWWTHSFLPFIHVLTAVPFNLAMAPWGGSF